MKMVALGEVASINRATVAPNEIPDDTQYVGLEHITKSSREVQPITAKAARASSTKHQFNQHQILYGKLRPYLAKIATPDFDGVCSTDILPLTPGENVDRSYLYYFLSQPKKVLEVSKQATGANLPRIKPATLENLKLPLPPLDEQRRIAAILDKADAIRQKRRQAITHLDTLTQSIFHDMFGSLEADETLTHVATVQGGLQVTSKRASNPIEVQYLRVANAHRGFLDLADVKSLRATQAEIDRTRLQPLDLLFAEGHANPLEVGRASIWNNEIDLCVHQNHLIRARLDQSKVHPQFALAWFNSRGGAKHFAKAARTTSGLNTISTTTVKTAPILIPPMEDQAEFCRRSRKITRERTARNSGLLKAELLNSSLQSRAFRGEL